MAMWLVLQPCGQVTLTAMWTMVAMVDMLAMMAMVAMVAILYSYASLFP